MTPGLQAINLLTPWAASSDGNGSFSYDEHVPKLHRETFFLNGETDAKRANHKQVRIVNAFFEFMMK